MSKHITSHKVPDTFYAYAPWAAVIVPALGAILISAFHGYWRICVFAWVVSLCGVSWMASPAAVTPEQKRTNITIVGLEDKIDQLETQAGETVDELLAEIKEKSGMAETKQALTLIFAGKILEMGSEIESYGIINDSQVIVLVHEDDVGIDIEEEAKKRDKENGVNKNEIVESEETENKENLDDDDEKKLAPVEKQTPNVPLTLAIVQEPDMISLECGDEARYNMFCGPEECHAMTQSSLLSYIQHSVADRQHTIQCPKCKSAWTYSFLRKILSDFEKFTTEVRQEIERKLSSNLMSQKMNANRCGSCSTILRRSIGNIDFVADCSACDADKFCWACLTPWKENAVACSNAKCPSWIREVTFTVLRKCPTKFIDHMDNVPVLRACPTCGQLITHISDCKHMDCLICHRSFCFVCVLPADDTGNYQCGYDVETCPLGDRQSKESLVATGLRNYSCVLALDRDGVSSKISSDSENAGVEEMDAEMGSEGFYEKFADEVLNNLAAAGWNDEGYDDDDY